MHPITTPPVNTRGSRWRLGAGVRPNRRLRISKRSGGKSTRWRFEKARSRSRGIRQGDEDQHASSTYRAWASISCETKARICSLWLAWSPGLVY